MKTTSVCFLFGWTMVILGLSDAIWKDLIVAVQTVLMAVIAPVAAYIMWKVNQKANLAVATLEQIVVTGEKSHDLANSFMLAQKKKLSDKSIRLAEVTKDPADIESAKIELAAYRAHKETDERMKKE